MKTLTRGDINDYLSRYNLDIRISKDARFVDQKCTPDIVCFIADCVLNILPVKKLFAINDIWQSDFFVQNSRAIFGKPWANNVKAHNEYNKVLSQPLKLLAYAHVLKVEHVNRTLSFSVENEDLLDYISMKDRNAYNFLYCYFCKVLSDSGFMRRMEEYKDTCEASLQESRSNLYKHYRYLISGNTPSHSAVDIDRMFHKVLNVYAAENNIPGSKGGNPQCYSDLMYNRTNLRDLHKPKFQTRREAEEDGVANRQAYNNYYIQKAINLIKKIQKGSEVHDSFSSGEATQVHHIFPKSEFPQIAAYLENLILLTATQHNTKAHPNNNTQVVDKDYQLVCLLAKAETIQKSIEAVGENYYRKESFVHVINVGLASDFSTTLTFSDIKSKLVRIYNEA